MVLPGEALLLLWSANQDLSLPCSFGWAGKISTVARNVGLAAIPDLSMVGVASCLGLGEALNRSCEPFEDPPDESSMVMGDNWGEGVAYLWQKGLI